MFSRLDNISARVGLRYVFRKVRCCHEKIRIGNPTDEATDMGHLCRKVIYNWSMNTYKST